MQTAIKVDENVLLPVVIMGAVILICFGISIKCFKWE